MTAFATDIADREDDLIADRLLQLNIHVHVVGGLEVFVD